MQTPDGMGADRYNERQNMREAAHEPPSFNYDVVAVHPETEEHLCVTDSTYSEEEAERIRDRNNNQRKRAMDREFIVVERDE